MWCDWWNSWPEGKESGLSYGLSWNHSKYTIMHVWLFRGDWNALLCAICQLFVLRYARQLCSCLSFWWSNSQFLLTTWCHSNIGNAMHPGYQVSNAWVLGLPGHMQTSLSHAFCVTDLGIWMSGTICYFKFCWSFQASVQQSCQGSQLDIGM